MAFHPGLVEIADPLPDDFMDNRFDAASARGISVHEARDGARKDKNALKHGHARPRR
jgi:hypothetical protein